LIMEDATKESVKTSYVKEGRAPILVKIYNFKIVFPLYSK